MSQFLELAELYARKGGRDAVTAPLGHLPAEDHDAHVALALQWAEGRLRSLVKHRYGQALPATPADTPAEVKGLVADLAAWNLELEHTDHVSPNVETLGQRALAQLRDVARGVAALDLPPAVAADDARPTVVVLGEDPRRPSMRGDLVAGLLPGGLRR